MAHLLLRLLSWPSWASSPHSVCFPSQPPRALVLLLLGRFVLPSSKPTSLEVHFLFHPLFFWKVILGAFSQFLEGSAKTLRLALRNKELTEHSRRVSKSTQVGRARGIWA